MTVEQPEGGLEGMGSQMKGFIKVMKKIPNGASFWFITPDNGGKDISFSSLSLPSFNPEDKSSQQLSTLNEELSNFPEGAKVIFVVMDTPKGPQARNLVLDTSGEVDTLVPAIEGTVSWIMG